MSKPIPGLQYIVEDGDTFETIAARAYGDTTQSVRIRKANQSEIISNEPVVGQVLIIPKRIETERLKSIQSEFLVTNKEIDELTIIIGGRQILPRTAEIITAIDTATHGFSFDIQWFPDVDPELDKLLLPYAYTPAQIYIGNELIINGFTYIITSKLSAGKTIKTIEVFSKTADPLDSSLKPPYEQTDVTLRQRAEELIIPFGIGVIYDVDTDETFDKVTARPNDSIFTHLSKLAAQRGVLMGSTPDGDVLFTKADVNSEIVGTIRQGGTIAKEWEGTWNGRKRFNVYKAIGQSSWVNDRTAVATDDNIPKTRSKTFTANDTTNGNIQQAADHRRSKSIADGLNFIIPVEGWIAPNGKRWKQNTRVTVIAPSLHIQDGFTFLIRAVKNKYDADTGRTSILHLTPPQSYTGEKIVEPWG